MRYTIKTERSWNLPGYYHTLIDTKRERPSALREVRVEYTIRHEVPVGLRSLRDQLNDMATAMRSH